MSGKRQHFIPRFLQQGFASHTDGDEFYTWVYRKNTEPFNTNLINVGVEKYFYNDRSDSSADDKITQAEQTYSTLVNSLNSHPFGPVSNPLIPEFISHLEVRTRHFRRNFLELSDYMIKRLLEFMSDEDVFIRYALKEVRNEHSLIHKDFIKEFEKHGYSKKFVKNWIKTEPGKVETLFNLLKPVFPSIVDNYREILTSKNISDWVKLGHVNVLKKSVSPITRINFYKKLTYSIMEIPNNSLILGDSAILFKVDDEKSFKTFTHKEDNILNILLPLSPSRLLIGKTDGNEIHYDEIIHEIARNSLEYFISSDENEKFISLQNEIGNEALLLTEEELENLVSEIFTT